MVGTFPEAGLGGVLVGRTVGMDGPEPFAVVPVHEVVADVGPGGKGAVRGLKVSVILPQPEVADDGFGEDPPLAGKVQGAVFQFLVNHRSVAAEAFVAGFAHQGGRRPHAVHGIDVVDDHRALEGEPGRFDVVPIGHTARQDGPVTLEIEPQVAVRAHHLVTDDRQQVLDCFPEGLVGPNLIKVRISLEQVQVRVHRLVGIDVVGAEGHVLERGEVARERLDVAAVRRILETGFHNLEQVDGVLQDFVVVARLVQFTETVDGESLRVQLFLGLQPLAGGVHAPIHAAVPVVAEMFQEIIPRMDGRHQVFRLAERPVGGGERPDDAGVQDDPARCAVQNLRGAVGLPVEPAARILQGEPVVQDVVLKDLADLLAKGVGTVHGAILQGLRP